MFDLLLGFYPSVMKQQGGLSLSSSDDVIFFESRSNADGFLQFFTYPWISQKLVQESSGWS